MTTLKLAAVVINAFDLELVADFWKELLEVGERDRVLELGGSELEQHELGGFSWTVYADPEGNEFCIAQADPDDYA